MKYIFSYVTAIEKDLGDGCITVVSEERDVNYTDKQRSLIFEKKGVYGCDGFVVVLYARRSVKEPRCGWRELAFMLGTWHLDSL